MIGKDPRNVEDILTVLYRAGCYRGGPILMSAIAGIDLRAQGRRRTTAARKEVRVMKPRLLPVHLEEHPSESFRDQLGYLEGLTGELVEWLEPAHIDDQVPAGTSAVVVPDLSGRAYRGWPVDPDGLCDLLLQLSDEYPQTPLLITENGAAYPDTVGADGRVDDPRRVAYFDIDHPGGDDRSRDFYRGVLGFEELDAGDFERGRRRTCWFASGPALLKVVEIGEKGDVGSWVDDDLQAGMRHAGFKVGDVDEQVRRLEAAGVEVLSPPRDVLGDVRIAFFLDPDGARLEYIQGNLRYEHVESPRSFRPRSIEASRRATGRASTMWA